MASSLLKNILHNSIADGLYKEIISRGARYYYFLGKTMTWTDELTPPEPVDSLAYENDVRTNIITLKEIKSTDVSFVIPKYDWESGVVFDQYDDQYSSEVQGINLTASGYGYAAPPYVHIGNSTAVPWSNSLPVLDGQMISSVGKYYIITTSGVLGNTAPIHTEYSAVNGTATLKHVVVITGNGIGAKAQSAILDGNVIDITVTSKGIGYTTAPSVIISGGSGTLALASAVVIVGSRTNTQKIEDAMFYVITDEYNVYSCLDNNNGAISAYKPIGTTVDPISMMDGYIWKFLYNVPIALRTKFISDTYIPVVTALTNQFYSNGNIENIRIDQVGSGYTSGTITVQGDGYLEADPMYLINSTISVPGTGYTSATISIDPPFTNSSTWLASTLFFQGQRLKYNNNIYEVAISGTTTTVAPTHKSGIISNGSAALKYLGTTATGTVTVSGGHIATVTVNGLIRDINITSGGLGYISAPTVNFSGGGGTGAIATTILQTSSVIKTLIFDAGQNYTSIPTVTFGTIWTATTVVTVNQQLYYSNRLYTVTGSGTTNSTAPTHLTGAVANGTASLTYVGSPAVGTCSLKYGAGYSSIPLVTITGNVGSANAAIYLGGIKSEAKLIPIFSSGHLSTVQIDDGGVGYTYVNLNVVGDGTGTGIVADLSPGNINSLQANVELLTVAGRIMNIPVVSAGYGYGAAAITIQGDGTGCTAVPVLLGGSLIKINITNSGTGYNWARITINGLGYGAKARAIISPYGGHGKEALNNLYAKTLMFYSNIAQDKNQGFIVNNDFRQLGIIKSPRIYNSTYPLVSILSSACWAVAGTISTTLFPVDSYITLNDTQASRFIVVTNTGTEVLLQSIDNGIPQIGSLFTNASNNTFSATAVTSPSADKYSGDLLFIDNKQAFTPTEDQNVTLRTVIKF